MAKSGKSLNTRQRVQLKPARSSSSTKKFVMPTTGYTLKEMIPRGQTADQSTNMPAHTPTDKRIIEFVLMQGNNELVSKGEPKGLTLPSVAQFEDIIAKAMSLTVDINMDSCNVIARRFVKKVRHMCGGAQLRIP